MIAGLLVPTRGHGPGDGPSTWRAEPEAAKAQLGFLTGSTGLYAPPHRARGADLLRAGLRHAPAALSRSASARWPSGCAIEPLLDRRCEGLSTGEKQRVSLARAVLHDPPVLVLDEPTNGLDVLASRFLRELVRAERDRGKAIIFSHPLPGRGRAAVRSDRAACYRGRLLREAPPAGAARPRPAPAAWKRRSWPWSSGWKAEAADDRGRARDGAALTGAAAALRPADRWARSCARPCATGARWR